MRSFSKNEDHLGPKQNGPLGSESVEKIVIAADRPGGKWYQASEPTAAHGSEGTDKPRDDPQDAMTVAPPAAVTSGEVQC